MLSKSEIAWLAGLFEGEGNIYMALQRNGSYCPALSIASCDLDILEKVVSVTGMGKVYDLPARKNCRQQFQWRLGKSEQVWLLVEKLMPWLGQRRVNQIEAAQAKRDIGKFRECAVCGNEISISRQTNTCSNECFLAHRREYHRNYYYKKVKNV